jgi:hypothetical protein
LAREVLYIASMTVVSRARRAIVAARSAGWPRFAASVLAVLALVVAAPAARAQEVTGLVGSVLRVEPNGTTADNFSTGNPHPGGVPLNVVNYEDCEANLSFEFTLSLSALYPNYNLVAWAGPVDCTAAAARESANAACWPLTAGPIPQNGATDDAGALTTTVKLRMQDIVSHAGVSGPITPSYSAATSAACLAQSETAQNPIAIYFFFTDSVAPGNAIGVAQAYPIVADTRAENVGESGFTVAQQIDSQLTVSITAAADPDTLTYNIYCDPPPGKETVVNQVPYDAASNNGVCVSPPAADAAPSAPSADAGDTGDGGGDAASDAGTTSAADSAPPPVVLDDAGGNPCGVPLGDSGVPDYGSCSPGSVLQPGGGSLTSTLVPETDDAGVELTDDAGAVIYVEAGVVTGGKQTLGIPSQYLCGTVAVGNPTYTITGLRDGYYYTIAVAAVDGAGNIGPLATACGEPVQLADFWYNYTAAGGQAGGGYCSAAEGVGVPAGTSGLGVLMFAGIVAVVRKRRR